MSALDCRHDGPAVGLVCRHLLDGGPGNHFRHFTGKGLEYHLVCPQCRPPESGNLRTLCPTCLRQLEAEVDWSGIDGRPETRERPSSLSFRHETVRLTEPVPAPILDIQPLARLDRNLWVALTGAGELLQLDLDQGSAATVCRLPPSDLNLSQKVSLLLSGNGRFAALTNPRGRHGVVIDLLEGRATMLLDRDDYHNEHCTFPVAFFEEGSRTLLIHGTDWNRLDISDPLSGELLTTRSPTSYNRGEQRPEHYLDYFHCRLCVSPDGTHVAEDGWVWHPVGEVVVWGLRPWLGGNVWEAEDGASKRCLCHRDSWDLPLCWVGADRLAVWGYGQEDTAMIPAVRIFDVVGGEEVRWFPGPQGELAFDEYLYSFDPTEGTSGWDIDTGERLLREEVFCPLRHHPSARSFLTLEADGSFRVTRLRGRPIDPNWLSSDGGTVVKLAHGIAAECAFDALPVLADALEDAGCNDRKMLDHCRRPGPHSTRCWVIDVLLEEGCP
jgi:hypothetical protein